MGCHVSIPTAAVTAPQGCNPNHQRPPTPDDNESVSINPFSAAIAPASGERDTTDDDVDAWAAEDATPSPDDAAAAADCGGGSDPALILFGFLDSAINQHQHQSQQERDPSPLRARGRTRSECVLRYSPLSRIASGSTLERVPAGCDGA
jgi:hypothetical protein